MKFLTKIYEIKHGLPEGVLTIAFLVIATVATYYSPFYSKIIVKAYLKEFVNMDGGGNHLGLRFAKLKTGQTSDTVCGYLTAKYILDQDKHGHTTRQGPWIRFIVYQDPEINKIKGFSAQGFRWDRGYDFPAAVWMISKFDYNQHLPTTEADANEDHVFFNKQWEKDCTPGHNWPELPLQ